MQAFMTRFLRSPVFYTIPIPKPEANELLVKVAYVSLNPTDCSFSFLSNPLSFIIIVMKHYLLRFLPR